MGSVHALPWSLRHACMRGEAGWRGPLETVIALDLPTPAC